MTQIAKHIIEARDSVSAYVSTLSTLDKYDANALRVADSAADRVTCALTTIGQLIAEEPYNLNAAVRVLGRVCVGQAVEDDPWYAPPYEPFEYPRDDSPEQDKALNVLRGDVVALNNQVLDYVEGINQQLRAVLTDPSVLDRVNLEAYVNSVVDNMEMATNSLANALSAIYNVTWAEPVEDATGLIEDVQEA